MDFDTLDKQMRKFEQSLDRIMLEGIYLVARLDGHGFTRLTKKDLEGAEFLEDGEHIKLPDGRIVRATRAKKTTDGGYASVDGTTRYTEGRVTGSSSQSTTAVPRTAAPKARNFAEDDDMDYGFLHSGSGHDDD